MNQQLPDNATLAELIALEPNHPLNVHPSPMSQWDSDMLVRLHLQGVSEPQGPINTALAATRLQMFRVRMFELQALRDRYHPRVNLTWDRELAAIMYKRKTTLWMAFPVCNLPTEILTHIFRLVVWSSATAEQATRQRLILTWVCRRFRDVAIGDCTLWNSVWFRDSPPWTRSLTSIERAGTAPLDVRIDEKKPDDAPVEERSTHPAITIPQINLILDVLLPRIAQLRILVVVLEKLEVAEHFMRRFMQAGRPELLERFEIHRVGQPWLWPQERSGTQGGLMPFSQHPTPKLRWFCLNGVTVDWNRFPPANLLTLDLRRMCQEASPSAKRFSEILRAAPHLFKLTMEGMAPQLAQQPLGNVRPVELPSLRDLSLGEMPIMYAVNALAHIHAPNVMNLRLAGFVGRDCGVLLEMLRGRFPNVRLLQVLGLDIDKTDLNVHRAIRWFDSMPRVRFFKFAYLKAHFLEALLADPSPHRGELPGPSSARGAEEPPVVCPELEVLYYYDQSQRDIATVAHGRKVLGKPIKRAYVLRTRDTSDSELAEIRPHVTACSIIERNEIALEEVEIHQEISRS